MAIADIVISRTSLIVFAILLFLTIINGIAIYLIRKKIKLKVKETPEYKKELFKFEKLKTIKVTAKADKTTKAPVEDKIFPFNMLSGKKKWSYEYWKTWYLDHYHPGKVVLINMELTNGFHRSFTVKEKDEGFKFRDKKYLFDDDSKYYNMDAKLYAFDYHEQITLPFKRKIPVTDVKKTIESTDEIDIEYAINPSTLQRFMTAKIAEGVMKGTQLDEFMRKLQTFLLVTMIASVVHLALFLYASGILENINIGSII